MGIRKALSICLCALLLIVTAPRLTMGAAVTYVQSTGAFNFSTTTTTLSVTFPSSNTAGNTLIIGAFWDAPSGQTATVSDSAGNTYIAIGSPVSPWSTRTMQIFYARNCKAGANTVTLTLSSTANRFILGIHEYSSLVGPLLTDEQVANAGSIGGAGSAASNNLGATTVAHDLVFAWCAAQNANATAGSGFTQREQASVSGACSEDVLETATGVYNAPFNLDASGPYAICVAAFGVQGFGQGISPMTP